MNRNIIFIAGVHGVGKTTFCEYISKKYDIKYYLASELIAEARKTSFTTLFVEGINENQTILVDSVKNLNDENKEYILDGHFCLLNEHKSIVQIPEKTFELLGIKTIIILIDNINSIHNRLKKRTGIEYSLDIFNKLQQNEVYYSQEIASILNVPYIIFDKSNMDEYEIDKELDYIFKKI